MSYVGLIDISQNEVNSLKRKKKEENIVWGIFTLLAAAKHDEQVMK